MGTVVVQNLRKVFANGHEALKDISFRVQAGELVSIIGRSGAGKSTLLRCLNGLLPVTSGRVIINDVEISNSAPEQQRTMRKRIGFVYQDYNLVDRSTAFRNVISGRLGQMPPWRSVLGRFPAQDRLIALRCLDQVQLLHKAEQRADRLSGGEKQRVAIGRALAQEPWLILADEPVASLDPELSHEVMGFLRKAASDAGVPVLVNIHDVLLAKEYSDRIIGIAEGQLAFDGAPAELTENDQRRIYRRDSRTYVGAERAGARSQEVALGDIVH